MYTMFSEWRRDIRYKRPFCDKTAWRPESGMKGSGLHAESKCNSSNLNKLVTGAVWCQFNLASQCK